jgi:hypothetical protein
MPMQRSPKYTEIRANLTKPCWEAGVKQAADCNTASSFGTAAGSITSNKSSHHREFRRSRQAGAGPAWISPASSSVSMGLNAVGDVESSRDRSTLRTPISADAAVSLDRWLGDRAATS